MKIWEVNYWYEGVYHTEYHRGATKMVGKSIIVQRYKCDIKFDSVIEVSEVPA